MRPGRWGPKVCMGQLTAAMKVIIRIETDVVPRLCGCCFI